MCVPPVCDYDIFIGCFNPDDLVHGHEQDRSSSLIESRVSHWLLAGAWGTGVLSLRIARSIEARGAPYRMVCRDSLRHRFRRLSLRTRRSPLRTRREAAGSGDPINHAEPVETRHLDIDKGDVRRPFSGFPEPLNTVRTLSDHLDCGLAFQQFAEISRACASSSTRRTRAGAVANSAVLAFRSVPLIRSA